MNQRLAVVTGAAGGLGIPLARALGEAGHGLLLIDMSDTVHDVARDLTEAGITASSCAANLCTSEGLEAVVQAVKDQSLPLGTLVNNAGITRDARLHKMTSEEFLAVIDVNLIAAMSLTSELKELFDTGASVISMSSRAALGNFGQANYVASKSGLIGFTRALSQKWAPRVRANAVAPGLIDTPMTQAMPPDVLANLVASIPTGRIGRAEDIAATVAFLASEQASYITGQVMYVCGGRSIAP